ncbi:uncharacterized protein LOC143002876 isoform X2 [Genypterus blacodes]|uniref:uncharacterized protein LOC143002876 isoform X2 n=1 Tax=Genypterus blacodes TaxID=154954 RepID=UPI003F77676F
MMWSLLMLFSGLIGLHSFLKVKGYATLDLTQSCQSMSVIHQPSGGSPYPPQDSAPPFEVTCTPGQRGEPITVHLRSKSTQKFTGFLLEARVTEDGPPVGQFTLLDVKTSKLLTCNDSPASAVSQKNSRGKTSLNVSWTGQEAEMGVIFRATFVENFVTFWERVIVTLPPLTTTTEPSTTASTPETSTTSSTTTEPTNSPGISSPPAVIPTGSTPYPTNGTINETKHLDAAVSLLALSTGLGALGQAVPLAKTITHTPQVFLMLCRAITLVTQTAALTLLCLLDSINVEIIALASVATLFSLMQFVIFSLPIEPDHNLKGLRDYAALVCLVIHEFLTFAAIFVGLWLRRAECWILNVTTSYAVWNFLFFMWIILISIYRESQRSRGSQTLQGSSQHNKKVETMETSYTLTRFENVLVYCLLMITVYLSNLQVKLGAVGLAVSIFFYVGIVAFIVTVIVGIFV